MSRSTLWAHAAALGLVLVGLLAVVDPGWAYSADEGAAAVQARSLATGGGWIVEHPLPAADHDGRRYPFELSTWGEDGVAPYAKHPLYPALLAGADRIGGTTGMLLLSVSGTVGAAVAAALLARRVRPGSEVAALWAVGVASPLCFDALWLIAHSLGAAAVGGAVLAALRAADSGRLRWAAVSGGLLVLALALRTEVLFVALALALAAGATWWRTRERGWGGVVLAALGAVALVRVGEPIVVRSIVGDLVAVPAFGPPLDGGGLVAGRWEALWNTWLSPGAGGGAGVVLWLGALLAAGLAAWRLRQPEADRGRTAALALAAAGLALARAVLLPSGAIPGLLPAFPLLWLGLLGGGARSLASTTSRLLGLVAVLAALGILATQYRVGGSAEWGGRYFAVLLPLAVPVAVAGLAALADDLDRRTATLTGAGLAALCAAGTVLAVRTVHDGHVTVERRVTEVVRAADDLGVDVVVTSTPSLPRFAWDTTDDLRWLLVDVDRDGSVGGDLLEAEVDRFLLEGRELDATIARLGLVELGPRPARGLALVGAPRSTPTRNTNVRSQSPAAG